MGSSELFKGKVATQWKVYTEQDLKSKGIKLRNDVVHIRAYKQVAQFKIRCIGKRKGMNQKQTRGNAPQAI
jgi:hypothetical protein